MNDSFTLKMFQRPVCFVLDSYPVNSLPYAIFHTYMSFELLLLLLHRVIELEERIQQEKKAADALLEQQKQVWLF